MFVTKAKYNADMRGALRLSEKLAKLVLELQQELNRRAPQFSPDEIEQLIRLCHPDKHNNSVTSNAVTAKLMGMRKCKKTANTNG